MNTKAGNGSTCEIVIQGLAHLLRIRKTLRGIFFHRLQDDSLEHWVNIGVDRTWSGRHLIHLLDRNAY